MYEKVKRVVLDSGLWDKGRMSSHGFILSPSVYQVSLEKLGELEAIGLALRDCLAGLGQIAMEVSDPRKSHNHVCGMIARALRTGVPAIYHDIMLLNPGSVPSICKVDIMESEDGNFRIAEIDGHNKHGLGYSTLAARIRRAVEPQAYAFPGVAATLAEEIKRRGESSAVLLYADQERFYLPEFHILQTELANHGINLLIFAEKEGYLMQDRRTLVFKKPLERERFKSFSGHGLFVDFPFLYHNQELNERMANLYRSREIDFLIPPKPFLGSKAILALLRNDIGDKELEAILKSQIPPASLELLRQYIPETYLVHKRAKEEYWRNRCKGRPFVLKESISSGMKGTVFHDDPNFDVAMKCACGSYYRFILQEEVVNRSQTFQYFSDEGLLRQDDWFMRVTVHYAARSVADVVVTARRDKKVHGALDCLQLGAVIA